MARPGFFGTDGKYTFDGEAQFMTVPHLRNMYQNVGMFGMDDTTIPGDDGLVQGFLGAPYIIRPRRPP